MLGVFWGTGVGGGIVLDGKPWVGRSAGGEIGHVVVSLGGRRCPCGRRGCMEAYAGRGAMEARARRLQAKGEQTELFKIMEQRGRNRLTSGVIARALRQGDRMAQEMMDTAVEALGAGVASVCNVLDPEAVIIGGGLGLRMGQPYVERIAAAMRPHLFAESMPDIKLAELGDLGGAIGAALLAESVAKPAAEAGYSYTTTSGGGDILRTCARRHQLRVLLVEELEAAPQAGRLRRARERAVLGDLDLLAAEAVDVDHRRQARRASSASAPAPCSA